uniref:Uncharacterized protein n=1 Tax=Oryza rufipogon TaxID=4529 RepID=A0A0E0NG59_ORYRU
MARRRKRGRLEGKELGFKGGGNVGLGTDLGRSRRELALGGIDRYLMPSTQDTGWYLDIRSWYKVSSMILVGYQRVP